MYDHQHCPLRLVGSEAAGPEPADPEFRQIKTTVNSTIAMVTSENTFTRTGGPKRGEIRPNHACAVPGAIVGAAVGAGAYPLSKLW